VISLKSPTSKLTVSFATLWLLDGSCVQDDDVAFFAQRLGATEAERYKGFARRVRRRQFLLGRMLLRFAAARLARLPPGVFSVTERAGDAPQLTHPAEQSLIPYFSLSHSSDWVACVVSSNATVGVDIEVIDPSRDILASSRLAFHPEEHLWLLRQPSGARVSGFYEIWCSREALYKLNPTLKRDAASSPLFGPDGNIVYNGCGWHRYSLPRSTLAVVVCSDRSLSGIEQVELNGLTRPDWRLAN
jgi:4'-phosphopantetheinyl transferase